MDLGGLSNTIGTVLQGLVALCGAFLFAFWLALIIWAWRIFAPLRDAFAAILAVVLVAIFPIVGLLLYLCCGPRKRWPRPTTGPRRRGIAAQR